MHKDIEAIVQDVKKEYFVATQEMMDCAKKQRCDTPESAQDTKNFIHILKTVYDEQVDLLRLIVEATQTLNEKLKAYENRKEIFKPGPKEEATSWDDL